MSFLVATTCDADTVKLSSRNFPLKTTGGKQPHNRQSVRILMQRLPGRSDKVCKISRGKCGRIRVAICKTNYGSNHMNMARVTLLSEGGFTSVLASEFDCPHTHLSLVPNILAVAPFSWDKNLAGSVCSCSFQSCTLQLSAQLSPASDHSFTQQWQSWSSPLGTKGFRNMETSNCDNLGPSADSLLPLHRHKPECVQ